MAENSISPLPLGEGPGVRAADTWKAPNPYAQVALTYIRRPFSSVRACVLVISLLLVTIPAFIGHGTGIPLLSFPLLFTMFLFGMLAIHMKEQFADPRSHLMPDFRRAHMAVAASAALIFAVLVPSLLTWWVGSHSIALIAVMAFLFGTALWYALLQSAWLKFLALAGYLALLSKPAEDGLKQLIAGQCEAQAIGLLGVGVVMTLLGLRHLARLNEDMPEYHRRMPTGWMAKGRITDQIVNYDSLLPRKLMDWFREPAMARLTRHIRNAARSPWSRICRWQVGMPTGWPVWLWGLAAIGVLQFLNWHSPRRLENGMASMMVANSFAFFPLLLVTTQLAGWLKLRSCTLGYELMLPVNRRSYVRQLGAALALGQFQLWGVICAATTVWWLAAVATPPSLGFVGSIAAVALLTQIFQFGVVVFTFTMTSLLILRFAALFGSMIGSSLLVMGGARMNNFQLLPQVMPIAAGLAVLGAVLTYAAYRYWLVADLD